MQVDPRLRSTNLLDHQACLSTPQRHIAEVSSNINHHGKRWYQLQHQCHTCIGAVLHLAYGTEYPRITKVSKGMKRDAPCHYPWADNPCLHLKPCGYCGRSRQSHGFGSSEVQRIRATHGFLLSHKGGFRVRCADALALSSPSRWSRRKRACAGVCCSS